MNKEESDKEPRANIDDDLADRIADAVQLATYAFEGLDLPDERLDRLCDVVLSQSIERVRTKDPR